MVQRDAKNDNRVVGATHITCRTGAPGLGGVKKLKMAENAAVELATSGALGILSSISVVV